MATYYFRNTGDVNWGTATNWSLTDGGGATGAVPTAADNALFTSNSGNCTTNASARVCLTLNCTGYTNTLTLSFQLTVGGAITLSATMTIVATARLVLSATATITSNGCLVPLLRIGSTASITCTLADVLSVNDLLVAGNNAATFTINGNSISINTNLTIGTGGNSNTSQGTTVFNLLGTGTWTHNVAGTVLRNSLNINTAGTITCTGTISYTAGGLNYVTGTVNALACTLNLGQAATFNTNGITWGAVTISANITVTLSSNLQCAGTFTFGATAVGSPILNGSTIQVSGNLTTAATSGVLSGTTVVEMAGNGSINLTTLTTGVFQSPISINTPETITLVGNLRIGSSSFTYTAGKVVTTGSTISVISSHTFTNVQYILFPDVSVASGITLTMNEFFSGSPEKICNVNPTTADTTYTVSFSDGFEKITKFAKINGCIVARRLQLIALTDGFNNGNNQGIRFINQSPNGFAKNNPSVTNGMTFPTFSLTSDPTIN